MLHQGSRMLLIHPGRVALDESTSLRDRTATRPAEENRNSRKNTSTHSCRGHLTLIVSLQRMQQTLYTVAGLYVEQVLLSGKFVRTEWRRRSCRHLQPATADFEQISLWRKTLAARLVSADLNLPGSRLLIGWCLDCWSVVGWICELTHVFASWLRAIHWKSWKSIQSRFNVDCDRTEPVSVYQSG